MMLLSKLNSIAARIGIAIAIAIVLGLLTLIGLGALLDYYGYGQRDQDGRVRSHLIVTKSTLGIINPWRNPAMLSGRIAVIIRSVAAAPESEQQRLVAAIKDPEVKVTLEAAAPPDRVARADEYSDRLRQFIQMQLDMLPSPISVTAYSLPANYDGGIDADNREASAVVEAALQNGRRIRVVIPYDVLASGKGLTLFLISIAIVSGLVSVWTGRMLAAPIREFAHSAERLGVDLTMPPLAVRGPRELRTTIQAFNRMQHRLQRFLEDRTQMLAAISHDLRAPLARLRLRAELVSDGEQQRKMFDDLEAMNAMIESTLAFARDDARQEPRKLVDLGVLVGDVCEDVGDAGGKVSCSASRGTDVCCRPSLVRRAVTNLVENAVRYGGGAQVRIAHDADRVTIIVDDDGPGIPADELEKVFAPFYRRELARDPAKAGVGLGLSIARTVAREHGGDVTLQNREGGGLSALIELPIDAGAGSKQMS
jgi:signal transduction histidine kinase